MSRINYPNHLLWILTVCIWTAAPARSQSPDAVTRQEYEKKIESLEQRVTQLEGLVHSLLAEKETAPLPVPVVTEAAPPPAEAALETPRAPARAPERFETPPELLPEIGKVGAEVGLLMSGSLNPYHLNAGSFAGGFIDLPLFDRPSWLHGKVSYEILVGLSNSKTRLNTTSNVAQVANLAVLTALNPGNPNQNVTDAITGTGAAPFPVTTNTETRLRLLEVVPFSLKYTTNALDRWRLRPYLVAGWGTYVTIHEQSPARGTPPTYGVRPDANLPPALLAVVQGLFGGTAPFGEPLVAGQIGQAPQLEALGLPSGHGNIDYGLSSGAGFEFRVSRLFSIGLDARFNKIAGTPGLLTTYGTRLGFHF